MLIYLGIIPIVVLIIVVVVLLVFLFNSSTNSTNKADRRENVRQSAPNQVKVENTITPLEDAKLIMDKTTNLAITSYEDKVELGPPTDARSYWKLVDDNGGDGKILKNVATGKYLRASNLKNTLELVNKRENATKFNLGKSITAQCHSGTIKHLCANNSEGKRCRLTAEYKEDGTNWNIVPVFSK